MTFSSTSRPSVTIQPQTRQTITGRVVTRFPTSISGTGGITVSKDGGNWTIDPSWEDLALVTSLDYPETKEIWARNPDTDEYVRVQISALVDSLLGGHAGSSIYVRASAPSTSVAENSIWIDSDSTDLDVYQLTSGSWVDTGSNLKGATWEFDTVAEVAATNINAGLDHIRVAGATAPGDGGGALYKRVVSEPSHNGKVQSSDGAWWELAETIIYPEMLGAKGDFDPDTLTGTDDAGVINDALDYLRTLIKDGPMWGNPQFITRQLHFRPGAIYRIGSPINFTGFRNGDFHVYGNGCTFFVKDINDHAVFDALYSVGIKWHDFMIYSENGATSGTGVQPKYGIVIGRKDSEDASLNHFQNVSVVGWYNGASLLNISSELNKYDKCNFHNSVSASYVGSDMAGLAVHLDPENASGFASTFQTIGTLPTFGMNEQLFLQCNLNSSQSGCVRIEGKTRSVHFVQCYAACASAYPAVRVLGDNYGLELDIHVETANATYNLLMDATSAAANIYGLRLHDTQTQAGHVIGSTGANAKNIINGDIRLPTAYSSSTRIFMPSSGINYRGRVSIGSTIAGLNNIQGANSFRGEIFTEAAASTIAATFSGSGYAVVYGGGDSYPSFMAAGGVAGVAYQDWYVPGLQIRSSGSAYVHKHVTSEATTADRTISWNVGDASRNITLGGNITTAGGNVTLRTPSSSDATIPAGTVNLLAGSTGSTDNAVLLASGTGGVTVKADSGMTWDGSTLLLTSSSNYLPQFKTTNSANHASASYWYLLKTRSGGPVNAGDPLGTLLWAGLDTGSVERYGALVGVVADSVGANYVAGKFNFYAMDTAGGTSVRASLDASTLAATVNITTTAYIKPGSFTVATLPAGSAGATVFCSNCRMFNGAGTQEGAGAGTGGLVTHNGTAWKIEGTNVTAVA